MREKEHGEGEITISEGGAGSAGQIIDGHGCSCCVNAITGGMSMERSVSTLNI